VRLTKSRGGGEAWTVAGTVQFLRGLWLFADLSEQGLAFLARACIHRHVERGVFLFFQSDPPEAVFVVCSGAIAVVLTSADGRELVINEVRSGDCFGELAPLTGLPRSASAAARVDSDVLAIPSAAFRAVLDSEPSLARRLLEILARRLQESTIREGAMAFLDAEARLARILLQLDEQASERGYVTISQEELAQRVGLTRQTVAKALGRWRRRGWLVTGRGHIVVFNHGALRQLGE
jgi:CRP/FNR family cyclic AMP-dependent transcriptional regulator